MNVRVFLLLAAAAPAFAQFTPVTAPSGSYTSGTAVIPITPPNNTPVGSITDGIQTVSFSVNLSAQTVPGGGWSTWGAPPNTETATPRVLALFSGTTATLTLSQPARTFGFEIEPNNFGNHTITATFMGGSTTLGTVTLSVAGNAGALLAAAVSTPSITSVVISAPTAGGFAIAQVRYSLATATTVPALTTTGVCGLGMLLAAAGALLARKQQLV